MGQTSSTTLPSGVPDVALHCLRVAEGSPAYGHLEPFFDYLIDVQVDSAPLSPGARLDAASLGPLLHRYEGKDLAVKVYNAKSQRIRGESPRSRTRVSSLLTLGVRCTPGP